MTSQVSAFNFRRHIQLVGREIEHCTGIRAIAVAHGVDPSAMKDQYELFDACEAMIGSEYLFEGYRKPHGYIQQGPILGRGFPFPSLEAYIDLRELYGNDWLFRALADYAAHFGPYKYKKHGDDIARKWLLGAKAYFLEQEFKFAGNALDNDRWTVLVQATQEPDHKV